jgi:hypothetical protein
LSLLGRHKGGGEGAHPSKDDWLASGNQTSVRVVTWTLTPDYLHHPDQSVCLNPDDPFPCNSSSCKSPGPFLRFPHLSPARSTHKACFGFRTPRPRSSQVCKTFQVRDDFIGASFAAIVVDFFSASPRLDLSHLLSRIDDGKRWKLSSISLPATSSHGSL